MYWHLKLQQVSISLESPDSVLSRNMGPNSDDKGTVDIGKFDFEKMNEQQFSRCAYFSTIVEYEEPPDSFGDDGYRANGIEMQVRFYPTNKPFSEMGLPGNVVGYISYYPAYKSEQGEHGISYERYAESRVFVSLSDFEMIERMAYNLPNTAPGQNYLGVQCEQTSDPFSSDGGAFFEGKKILRIFSYHFSISPTIPGSNGGCK